LPPKAQFFFLNDMPRLIFITHPDVTVDPGSPIEDWSLSAQGKARAKTFSRSSVLRNVTQLWSSAEKKAQDTAAILSNALSVTVQTHPQLGENDRSATGFLPPEQFEAAADAFFADPAYSFRGWETASRAQARIVEAISEITAKHETDDIAIVSHGGVGTLFFCHCLEAGISRTYDQPHQGHYWVAELPKLIPVHGWRAIG
jgi:broad specificity phosphatase PhoE